MYDNLKLKLHVVFFFSICFYYIILFYKLMLRSSQQYLKHAKKTLLYTHIFIDTYILHVTDTCTVTANFAKKKMHKINFLFFRTLEKSEFTDNIDKSQVLISHALTIIF